MLAALQRHDGFLVTILFLTVIAHVLDFVIMMPLGPMILRDFDITAATFGYLISIYTVAAAISSFFGSAWLDLIDRKVSLLLLLVGFTIGNGMCFWAPTPFTFGLGRVIAGVFGGVMQAVVFSIIAQLISVDKQGKASGAMGAAFPLVSILGVPLGLKIADLFGWRSAFILVIVLSGTAFLLSLLCLPRVPPESKNRKYALIATVKSVLAEPVHRQGMLLMFLTIMGGFVIVPYIAPFLINNGYIESSQLYLVYLVGGSCSIVSARIIGIFADKYGRIRTLRFMLVGAACVLAFFTNLPKGGLWIVLVGTSLAMVFLPGRIICVMAWITTVSKPESRGAFLSLVSTLQSLSIGLATIIGGLLVGEGEGGALSTYWLAGLVAITANLTILCISPWFLRSEQAAFKPKASA